MNHIEKWNTISQLLDLSKDLDESKHQDIIYKVFTEFLEWPDHAIEREVKVQQGSTQKKVDFALKQNGICILPIEAKISDKSKSGVKQLGSYMIYMQADMGILIGNKFYFFYDVECGRNIETLDDAVLVVPFKADSTYGEKIIKLLDYPNFNINGLKTFLGNLHNKKEDEFKQRNIKERIVKIIKSEGFIQEAIKSRIYSEGYLEPEYGGILDEIIDDFEISDKSINADKVENTNSILPKEESSGKRHRFKFNGKIYNGCTELAYAIILKYATVSNCTVKELRKELQSYSVTSSVFKLDKDYQNTENRSWPERTKMTLPGDGSIIRIFTMWNYYKGNDNFSEIIDFAENQGWEVDEIE